jgi:hypothetical protein
VVDYAQQYKIYIHTHNKMKKEARKIAYKALKTNLIESVNNTLMDSGFKLSRKTEKRIKKAVKLIAQKADVQKTEVLL